MGLPKGADRSCMLNIRPVAREIHAQAQFGKSLLRIIVAVTAVYLLTRGAGWVLDHWKNTEELAGLIRTAELLGLVIVVYGLWSAERRAEFARSTRIRTDAITGFSQAISRSASAIYQAQRRLHVLASELPTATADEKKEMTLRMDTLIGGLHAGIDEMMPAFAAVQAAFGAPQKSLLWINNGQAPPSPTDTAYLITQASLKMVGRAERISRRDGQHPRWDPAVFLRSLDDLPDPDLPTLRKLLLRLRDHLDRQVVQFRAIESPDRWPSLRAEKFDDGFRTTVVAAGRALNRADDEKRG